jgi:hypothetical protein
LISSVLWAASTLPASAFLDLRPSGRFARVVVGIDGDGAARYKERELDEGDVINGGTTDIEGYGTTPVERAKFIPARG